MSMLDVDYEDLLGGGDIGDIGAVGGVDMPNGSKGANGSEGGNGYEDEDEDRTSKSSFGSPIDLIGTDKMKGGLTRKKSQCGDDVTAEPTEDEMLSGE